MGRKEQLEMFGKRPVTNRRAQCGRFRPRKLTVVPWDRSEAEVRESWHRQSLTGNFSPDGTKIVFESDRMSTDHSLDVFTVNTDGSGLTRIATGVTVGGCADTNCVNPAWGKKP
jgi:hypothetical protein